MSIYKQSNQNLCVLHVRTELTSSIEKLLPVGDNININLLRRSRDINCAIIEIPPQHRSGCMAQRRGGDEGNWGGFAPTQTGQAERGENWAEVFGQD